MLLSISGVLPTTRYIQTSTNGHLSKEDTFDLVPRVSTYGKVQLYISGYLTVVVVPYFTKNMRHGFLAG